MTIATFPAAMLLIQKAVTSTLGNPPPELVALRPARNHPATKNRRTVIAHASRPDAARVSLTFIRNLCGCLSKYRNPHPTLVYSVPGGKVNILAGHGIRHSKQKSVYVHVSYSERFPR
jgi:hypothetical protein